MNNTFNPDDLSTYKVTKLPTFTKEDYIQSEVNDQIFYYLTKGKKVEEDFIQSKVQTEYDSWYTSGPSPQDY